MGKLKKVKKNINTYSKKGGSKPTGTINLNIINNCTINVTNNYYFFPSKSSSCDEFDQLLKGPIYNVPSETSHSGFSKGNNKFFVRQDTISFYNSDATPDSISSVHLFKDVLGDSPDFYSPNDLPTPPTYRKEKNRLVLKTCGRKNKNRVFKKKTKRITKFKNTSVDRVRSVTAASSTPNNLLSSQKNAWTEPHVSPIIPFHEPYCDTLNNSMQDLFAPLENNQEENVSPKHAPNMSDLVNCFDNLGLNTTATCLKTTEKEQNSKKEINKKTPVKVNISDFLNESIVTLRLRSSRKRSMINKECKPEEVCHDKEQLRSIEKERCGGVIDQRTEQGLGCSIRMAQNLIISPVKKTSTSEICKEDINNEDQFLNFVRRSKNRTVSQVAMSSRIPVSEGPESRCSLTHLEKEKFDFNHDKNILILDCDSPKIKHDAQLSDSPKIETENNISQKDIIQVKPALNITAGSKWKKDFIQQKQTNPFRSSVQPGVLVQLLQESENISFTSMKTRYSCDPATSVSQLTGTHQFIKRKTDGNVGMERSMNMSGFTNMLEIFNRVTKRKKQSENYYTRNLRINSVIEESPSRESCNHSADENNISIVETRLSVVTENTCDEKEDTNEILSSIGAPKTEPNKTLLTELNISTSEIGKSTPPILRPDIKSVMSSITKRKKPYFSPELRENLDFSKAGSSSSSEDLSGLDILEEELDQSESPKFEGINEEELSYLIENNQQEFHQLAEVGFFQQCGLEEPVPFSEAFSDSVLTDCRKIGEGVYGEVFMLQRGPQEKSVLKIIPVEGSQEINGASQKRFDEVLSELIISEELSLLRKNSRFCTSGFCELKNKYCLQGQYPSKLIELWQIFKKTSESYNDCPDVFGPDQLYMALELGHAGEPVETYCFSTAKEAYSVFLQTTFSLAVAEAALEFEHRDLHVGNVLVKSTDQKYVSLIQNGYSFKVPTYGVEATIIDFTLARISFKDQVLFFDMEKDPDLFTAQGDYQFEVYRIMREEVKNNWSLHAPITNIRWLYYLIDKLITKGKFRRKKSKIHADYLKKLKNMMSKILDFMSSADLSEFLLTTLLETVKIIKTE